MEVYEYVLVEVEEFDGITVERYEVEQAIELEVAA